MTTDLPQEARSGPVLYRIAVQGRLDERWTDWFGEMAIGFDGGVTTLTGPVADQAALRGILSKIWDLNLALIAVNQIGEGASAAKES